MNKFMVKVTLKQTNLSGYTWINNKPSWVDAYVEVDAETLNDAIELVKETYGDENKYWIKSSESYMMLPPIIK
jgi:hypothetical protein